MTAFCLAAARPRCKRRPCLCGTDCGARFRCLGLAQAPAAAGEGMKEAPVNSPFSWSTNYRHPAEWDQIFAPLSLPDMLAASVARKGDAPMPDFMGRHFSYTEVPGGDRKDVGLGKRCTIRCE